MRDEKCCGSLQDSVPGGPPPPMRDEKCCGSLQDSLA
jgi:hypothetical protein